MFSRSKYIAVAVIYVFLGSQFLAHSVKADSATCTVTASPQNANSNSSSNFKLTITNSDSSSIKWIYLKPPSSSYSVVSASASGWSVSTDPSSSESTITGGNLSPGDSLDINLNVQLGDFVDGEADWNIFTSDDPAAADGYLCTGSSPSFMIDSKPQISDISVTNFSSSSVTIGWNTSLASNSKVNYGLGDNYGSSSATNNQEVTSHSVKLTGLAPNTGYHYQVSSTTADGVNAASGDSTFLTAIKEPGSSGSSVNTSAIGVTVTNPSDKTPPTISLDSAFAQKIYKTAPTFNGTAGDEASVVRVEYSTDGGKDWLPVDSAAGINTKKVDYSFTPLNLDDGDYSMLARAIDDGGNITASNPVTVVIDRLPPLIGGSVLSLGPLTLDSNAQGEISTLAGVDEKITLSAVGGPTSIVLDAINSTAKNSTKSFSLTKSADSGLWSGLISFAKPGSYRLVANSIDGAGNKTTKLINNVSVASPAKVLNRNGQPTNATVTAYYLEPDTNSWVVWDGKAYGQDNPQVTDRTGVFNLFLPTGTYYLKATGKGFASITTKIFVLKTAAPVVASLKASKGGFMGNITSNFLTQQINLNLSAQDKNGTLKNNLSGSQLPDFKLINTNSQTVNAASLLGRPTVLSFMSSWAPSASEQLPVLDRIAANKDINVIPVALQQSVGEAGAYQAISGYNLTWLADPDSSTSASFNVSNLPTHFFVNRNGIVKKTVTGVLSRTELLNDLTGL